MGPLAAAPRADRLVKIAATITDLTQQWSLCARIMWNTKVALCVATLRPELLPGVIHGHAELLGADVRGHSHCLLTRLLHGYCVLVRLVKSTRLA